METILIWIDTETTGLDPKHGRILEIAVVFTDLELNELAAYEAIIPQPVEAAIELIDVDCRDMHIKNGLIKDLRNHDNPLYQVDEIENKILDMMDTLDPNCDGSIKFIAAGSNVLFDIKWLIEHMPFVTRSLYRRSIEIEDAESFYSLDVRTYAMAFPNIFNNKSNAHRAMSDILESIEQHRLMLTLVNEC